MFIRNGRKKVNTSLKSTSVYRSSISVFRCRRNKEYLSSIKSLDLQTDI